MQSWYIAPVPGSPTYMPGRILMCVTGSRVLMLESP